MNSDMTSKAIQGFDWDKAFSDKSTEEKASIQSIRYFEQMQNTLRASIDISKQKYYFKLSRKLGVNKINPKCYWSILISFLSNKKIPCIPPLIHNNQFAVDFKEKANYLTHSLQSNALILRPV